MKLINLAILEQKNSVPLLRKRSQDALHAELKEAENLLIKLPVILFLREGLATTAQFEAIDKELLQTLS